MSTNTSASSAEEATIKYVCGIDIGSQSCAGCVTRPDKSVVVKPMTATLAKEGWQVLGEKLTQLDAASGQILIGMEATSRSGENLYQELEQRGYRLCLLHPGQTHQFHRQQGLRGKHGSPRCDDHRPCALELGGTSWLHP
jgi:transposase